MKKTKQYYVMQYEDVARERLYLAKGPFDSISSAEDWLKEEAKELLENTDEPVSRKDYDSWAGPSLVVEVVRSYQQIPSYQVDIKLKRL